MRLDGRTEKRVAMAIAVSLAVGEKPQLAELAMTVNVSPHGARVITKHRWHPGERPRIASNSGKFQAQAKVVYCEALIDDTFCVGLKFQSVFMDWKSY